MLPPRWLFLLLVFFPSLGLAAEPPLQVTKTSAVRLDIPAEIIAFYQQLVADHPRIRAEHAALVEAAREEPYRAPQASSEIAVAPWSTDEYTLKPRNQDPRFDTSLDAVYLAIEPIMLGFHHGYSVHRNIVARFRVKYQTVEQDGARDEVPALVENTLTLTFEGFQSLELKPSKN